MARILAAAHRSIAQRGAQTTIAHVASDLGVSRATVYRYFAGTTALLEAASAEGTRRFLIAMGERLRDFDDLAEAIIEGIVYTVTRAADEPYLRLLLDEPTHTLLRSVTSETAREVGATVLLEKTSIDWTHTALTSDTFDELVEWALRAVQSFLSDPGDPPRGPEDLRVYLRRWLAPAVRAWAVAPTAG